MFKILILKSAKSDLSEISNFYKIVSINLQKKFLKNFHITLEQLAFSPYFQLRYDEFRMRQVHKFPIIIHFIINEENKTIKIFGIRHSKQNPENYPKI